MIGAGEVTEIRNGPAFNNVTGSRLVAVMRRNRAKAAELCPPSLILEGRFVAGRIICIDVVNAPFNVPLAGNVHFMRCYLHVHFLWPDDFVITGTG